ncbi:MAG TPA: DNA polymerase III subunit gamma and tau [Mycobacteriales bacterium]|nr:DNA polymerase III subunit gamma and tau [Mycobacteriales bacterium]
MALYRKYRPGSFAEVVGQEHVTEPLQQALRTERIHHAYLFSGPRGCGKTSSARILARSLNCEKGPTPEPCGVCDSCVALAPNGPGSLDVIEIDAASHGLVDDARDLRERAFFAPVSSRFKIYIIDEAHMISQAAFNALLKVVEEPPPHVKFVFATTEPEKVLPTIKSRTFHYRFRLIPPAALREFLADLCQREGIKVDPLVLPLVVRAGAGSARDALSVLDQLAAGAGDDGISYERALSILGYTDAALLDEAVDAFAAGDGAAVFAAVDRVIEAGIDPRRFAQDLLERFRDLLVLDAVADAGDTGLLDAPDDALERMRNQATRFGRAALSRAGDVFAQALVDMRGTTSPRLVLELACARVLLPGASSDTSALLARLDRLERRLSVTATHAPAIPESTDTGGREIEPPAAPVAAPAPAPAAAPEPAPVPGGLDMVAVRRIWTDLLDEVNQHNKTAAALLKNAEPNAVDAKRLTVAFSTPELARMFTQKGIVFLADALRSVVGADLQVEVVVAGAATTTVAASADTPAPATPAAPTADDIDLSDSEEVEPEPEADPVALLQSNLGAQVIGEIDSA